MQSFAAEGDLRAHRPAPSPTRSISSKASAAAACTRPTHAHFYASHEGLHLLYEQAQTRFIPRQQRWYNLSTHIPVDRHAHGALDGAHVEYFRGISNPIGVKIGAAMDAAWLQGLVVTLNPQNQPGRLTLIHRLRREGHREIAAANDRGGAPDRPARCCGSATRCMATPRPARAGSRRDASRTSCKELELAFQMHLPVRLASGRRAHRAHRRGRHRMHRRRAWPHRCATCSGPTVPPSIRASITSRRWSLRY